MPERGMAFVATGLLLSSLWVVWVAVNSWTERRGNRMIRPALITLSAIVLGFAVAVVFLWPGPSAGLAALVGPTLAVYYTRNGEADPARRRAARVALLVALVGVFAGVFALRSVDLLL